MRSLELFSGAGGLALGLEQAGFAHVRLIEHNSNACKTLSTHFGDERVIQTDIGQHDFSVYQDIDLIAGGPPCQPFSIGGNHQGYTDKRDLFHHAIRAIGQLQPKGFVLENVRGLLRPMFQEYLEYLCLRLTYPTHPITEHWHSDLQTLRCVSSYLYPEVQYNVSHALLNAADFGVPQNRERVFIVGIRADLDYDFCFPTPTHSRTRLLWEMNHSLEYWQKHNLVPIVSQHQNLIEPTLKPWRTIRDAIGDLPDPRTSHQLPDHLFRDGARVYAGHSGSPLDWVSKTIKAGDHGVPGGENMILFPDGLVRYLTVLEAKRIQTFPDQYSLYGAWTEAMRQIGNAVPILLAQQIGKQLHLAINATAAFAT
jgi:DNA (cytosine-5)-methyltransferase 1